MKRKQQAGPSLFDDDAGSGAGEVASRAVDATASSPEPATRLDYATDPPTPVVGVPPLRRALETLDRLDAAVVQRVGQDVLEDMLVRGTGPTDGPTPVGFVTQATATRAEQATKATDAVAHHYKMSPVEREASLADIPDRSRWTYPGKGEVVVRGTSPLMVWFSTPSAPALEQMTLYRHVFLKGAKRMKDGDG